MPLRGACCAPGSSNVKHHKELVVVLPKPTNQMIDYSPEKIEGFHSYHYEWIDCLNFMIEPEVVLEDRASSYLRFVEKVFKEMDWQGDGKIQLLWIPPFVFPSESDASTQGVLVWHVKQIEDGIS
jgi:hypothetical protein